MKYFRVLIVITYFVAILFDQLSAVTILLHTLAVILTLVVTSRFSFFANFSKYVILLTYWISLMFMPVFKLVKNITGEDGAYGYAMTPLDYQRILSFSPSVIIVVCLSWMVFSAFRKKGRPVMYEYKPKLLSKNSVYICFAVMYFCSALAVVFGIGRMGSEDSVVLPFHLNGIIVLAKMVFFPILFAIIVENYVINKRNVPNKYYVLFTGWALIEVFTRLSKSALLNAFLTVAVLLFIYYRPKLKTIIKIATPLFAAFLLLYPIVEIMRSSGDANLIESFKSASSQDETSAGDMILNPLNRTFMIPSYYAKDYTWVNHNSLFDFSKVPVLLVTGGAARYQTIVIDGFPPDAVNSSGTTGLQDPLLFGGYGLCYIVIVLLMLFAFLIDSLVYKRMISIYVTLLLLLWGFCNSQNITSFTDAVGLQYIIMRLFAIWIAYRLNFRRRRIISL